MELFVDAIQGKEEGKKFEVWGIDLHQNYAESRVHKEMQQGPDEWYMDRGKGRALQCFGSRKQMGVVLFVTAVQRITLKVKKGLEIFASWTRRSQTDHSEVTTRCPPTSHYRLPPVQS